ncbi:lytic transglycosylase domain-containing protein [Roseovarius sp. D22-M7]|uniref:lytic transglycosylase domain-containing protein n=1 Tax=Roseovarius sp. D22-M7 TaxID=3127116 RepID=UPI00300F8395
MALADSFIFSVGPDGRLISISQDTSTLRSFPAAKEATTRLFLFAEPREQEAPTEAIPVLRASPETLHAIETAALRYAGDGALRRAGLSVTDWALLYRANIEVESAYNPSARSPAGAIGLGQLMPDTARDLGVDPHDVAQNLDGSARYLLMMLDQFGEGSLALAAYNAGPEAVTRHGGIPPFRETQRHVARVTAVFQRLRGDLP